MVCIRAGAVDWRFDGLAGDGLEKKAILPEPARGCRGVKKVKKPGFGGDLEYPGAGVG